MAAPLIGPQRPIPTSSIKDLRTPKYLNRFANKMRRDIEKLARLYSGKQVKLYSIDHTLERCPACIDELTGAVLVSSCKKCNGSGRVTRDGKSGLLCVGTFWAFVDLGPEISATGELGNFEDPNMQRDAFTVINAPPIKDKNLLILKDMKRVFKVIDEEPVYASIGGNIITQTVRCAMITQGSREYNLIDW